MIIRIIILGQVMVEKDEDPLIHGLMRQYWELFTNIGRKKTGWQLICSLSSHTKFILQNQID